MNGQTMEKHPLELTVNGKTYRAEIEHRKTLADTIREDCGLTGTHVGCEHGICGACTVTVDGMLTRSCLTLAVQVDGCDVRTVEGLAPEQGRLSILQAAFRRHHGLQCGFCTPGILMSLDRYLRGNPNPTEDQLRELLSGHLCRCTGYTPIIRAALEAAAALASATQQEDHTHV